MRSADLIRKIPEPLRDQFILDMPAVFQALLPLEKKVLRLIIDRIGYKPFDLGQMEKCMDNSLPGAQLKVGLLRLRQKGIIFTLRKTWGEHIYLIPRDSFATWFRLFIGDSFEINKVEDIERMHNSRLGMASDVFYLLAYIAKHGLPITQKGTIPKRHLQKITTNLNIKDEDLEAMSLQYAGQDLYPPSFAVIYDAALRLGLLQQDVDRVVLDQRNVRLWMECTPEQIQNQLYQMWTQLHIPSLTGIQHVTLLLEQLPRGEWFLLDPLFNYMVEQRMLEKDEKDDFIAAFEAEWLKPLVGLGWIEQGKTKNQQFAIRWTASVESGDKCFYIQPDFEIIVPPTVPFSIRWELECMAEPKQSDRISRYLITKESIHYTREQNRSIEDIIQFLKEYSKFGIPESVELTVEQWGTQFGQVFISEILLLSCRDEKTAQSIADHPQCAPFITTALGDKDFVITREHMPELLKNLEKYGFTPKNNIQTSTEKAIVYPKLTAQNKEVSDAGLNAGETTESLQGLIYAKYAVNYYEWETKDPQLEEVYPQLQDVPSIWLNEYRAYHKSTRKELIEKAIEWRAYLKMNKQGETIEFTPRHLQEGSDQQWKVRGIESSQEIWLSPEHWEEMQLILPGINDI
jgi:hypothetical protein